MEIHMLLLDLVVDNSSIYISNRTPYFMDS